MKKKCIEILEKLTNKKNIFFTNRGNTSINLALKLVKHLGKKKAFIQNQGGWITYEQYLQKLKFEYYLLDTDYGLVDIKLLKQKLDSDSVLLLNSMPGYFCTQENMREISELCKEKKCFLINDVSGSIGTNVAKFGDLIIGSFGRGKPVNNEYGGFISFENKEYTEFFEKNMDKDLKNFYSDLYNELKKLNKRLNLFEKTSQKVKEDLKNYDIIHRNARGINIVLKFDSPQKKLDIENYCKLYNYEFTLCPRYIRVMEPAISIEIKRIEV